MEEEARDTYVLDDVQQLLCMFVAHALHERVVVLQEMRQLIDSSHPARDSLYGILRSGISDVLESLCSVCAYERGMKRHGCIEHGEVRGLTTNSDSVGFRTFSP
jgi:hypothetical protein